jgi:hypothetical protein
MLGYQARVNAEAATSVRACNEIDRFARIKIRRHCARGEREAQHRAHCQQSEAVHSDESSIRDAQCKSAGGPAYDVASAGG